MEINLTIRRIKGALLLPIWEGKAKPTKSSDLMNAIKNFASFMGLSYIPGRTIERLQNDQEYRICFTPTASVSYVSILYDEKFGKNTRERLLAILTDPDKVTNEDLIKGFGIYLNNFHSLMPGGYARDPDLLNPESDRSYFIMFSQIDEILKEKGLMGKAVELGSKKLISLSPTPEKSAKVEYYRICLEVFNELIGKYGYTRYDLIK